MKTRRVLDPEERDFDFDFNFNINKMNDGMRILKLDVWSY